VFEYAGSAPAQTDSKCFYQREDPLAGWVDYFRALRGPECGGPRRELPPFLDGAWGAADSAGRGFSEILRACRHGRERGVGLVRRIRRGASRLAVFRGHL